MKPVLDSTAGNRIMYRRKEGAVRSPAEFIYMDKEYGLSIKPDIFADFTMMPFRDNVFSTIIFDPPFGWTAPPWMKHPEGYVLGTGVKGKFRGSWYGVFKNRRDLIISIMKAQKEFSRVSTRLCFKWNEYAVSLWNILSLFRGWTIINRLELIKPKKRGRHKTWWITMVKTSVNSKSLRMV